MLSLNSVQFARFIENLGIAKPCWLKRIPDLIMKSPLSVQQAFLRGLFSADGTVYLEERKTGRGLRRSLSLSTISDTLSQDVMVLLGSMGIISNLSTQFRRGREEYQIRVIGKSIKTFLDTVGLLGVKSE